MKRLYLQIYLAVLGVILLFSVLTAAAFWFLNEETPRDRLIDEITAFAEVVTPDQDAAPERLQRFVEAIALPLSAGVALYDRDGLVLAQAGRRVPKPPISGGSQWLRRHAGRHRGRELRVDPSEHADHRGNHGPRHQAIAIALADGRWIVIDGDRGRRPMGHIFAGLAFLTLATAIAAFPLARRLTRRLESLKAHVEAFGEGQLDRRAAIQGDDEVADLAAAFNATADRIEDLIADKTRMLANTSHELRTPLTRIRMAIALIDESSRPDLLERISLDIEELDLLIGELLVSSRLDAPDQEIAHERIDLLALAAEEAARLDAAVVSGTSQLVDGDPRLLRRLLRNLLENAVRHGEAPIDVRVSAVEDDSQATDGIAFVRLVVDDRGPGIPESERERIFERFYRRAGEASAEGGIGLGLALVRQIAERHHGRIHCEDRSGGGTRFVLELPAARG